MPGGSDCLIKFGSRADYNRFVGQLRSQLRSYLISSCHEHKIEIGSPDYAAVEAILMDVSPPSCFFSFIRLHTALLPVLTCESDH